ncbi:peptidoglycan-binding domain-containing protein [Clostridium tyrobutyricum]|uniref:peptidoglycan-binding domain-containing protein n=1 Tax=Clostridium tyrobutyricum TaxID=1519 RepID=UPI001C38CCCD|nr:peptidoglycan-binding protein [Clostridium tyrobutyricum]MBV4423246.1 peptidoglycan-binding protein [Clostridium tyrobutyricum]
MEFWLKQDNDNSGFQLPVNPSKYEIARIIDNGTFDTEMSGERSFLGTSKLKTFEINSFFPLRKYNFLLCAAKDDPYDYIRIIESWIRNKWPVRVIITQTLINLLCSIDEFHYGEDDGTRDVTFTISFKEYIKVESIVIQDATGGQSSTASSSSPSANSAIKTLQQNLNRLKIPPTANVNGINDSTTKTSVKKFQSIMGLKQDGVYGTNTSAAMKEVLSKPMCGIPYVHRYATRYIQWWVGAGIDGIFGIRTKIAVQTLQKKNKISADGIVGPITWGKIFN